MRSSIDVRSFMVLVIFFTIGTSILIAPSGLTYDAKQDAWIACLIGLAVDIALVWLYIAIGERYPGKSVVEICELALGRWVGKLVAGCYVLFFYLLATLMIGDMGIFITTQIMPETPIEIIKIIFTAAVVLVVGMGMKVYAYMAEIFFPWIILLLLLLIVPSGPKMELSNLKPMLEFGFMPVWKSAFNFFTLQEMIVLLMVYPYVTSNRKQRRRAFVFGGLIGAVVLALTTLASILVLGQSLTANQLFPAYVLAKHLSLGQFFERLEAMMMFIWILTIFVKITITFHASAVGMTQLLRLDDEKPFIWPLAMIMIALSLMCYPNALYVRKLLSETWPPFAFIFMVIFPCILLAASAIRARNTTAKA